MINFILFFISSVVKAMFTLCALARCPYDSSKKLMWTIILIGVFTPEFGNSTRAPAQSLDLVLGTRWYLGWVLGVPVSDHNTILCRCLGNSAWASSVNTTCITKLKGRHSAAVVFSDGEEISASLDISRSEVNNGSSVFRKSYLMTSRHRSNHKCLCGCELGLFINLANDVLFYWSSWGQTWGLTLV